MNLTTHINKPDVETDSSYQSTPALRWKWGRGEKNSLEYAEWYKHQEKGCLDKVEEENILLTVVFDFYMHALKTHSSFTCTHESCYIHNRNVIKRSFNLPI